MTDKLKIMTDNEIIKAFKDFLIEQVDGYTDHVETGGERYEFIEKELELLKETDDLINRQQAEIERLKGMVSQNEGVLPRYEQLIKAEAYKEFAERLKHIIMWSPKNHISITAKDIDNLVKEMVGDNNA